MAESADFLLSHREFDILWSDMDTGAMPYPLEVTSHGATVGERDAIRAEVYAALRDRRLFAERLNPELEGLLRLLAKPRTTVDLVGHADRMLRAVASGNGRAGVLAVLSETGLELTAIRPTALAIAIVGLLPEAGTGEGRSLAVRHSDLVRCTEEDEDDPLGLGSEEDSLIQAGMSAESAHRLLRLAEGRIGGGQFGVSTIEQRRSVMRRASTLVTWFDTESSGRFLMVRDGDWLSIAASDGPRIANRIDEVLTAEAA